MRYALNIDEDGRILSVTYEEFASDGMPIVEELLDADMADYRYVNNEYVYDPIQKPELKDTPTQLDRIEAQLAYTAMMAGTLIEV